MAGLAGHQPVLTGELVPGRQVIEDRACRGRVRQAGQRQQQRREDPIQHCRSHFHGADHPEANASSLRGMTRCRDNGRNRARTDRRGHHRHGDRKNTRPAGSDHGPACGGNRGSPGACVPR